MAQYVLRENGKVVTRRSIRRLTPGELAVSNAVEAAKVKRSLFQFEQS